MIDISSDLRNARVDFEVRCRVAVSPDGFVAAPRLGSSRFSFYVCESESSPSEDCLLSVPKLD